MTPRLIQNIRKYNRAKGINNNLIYVSCQWRWYSYNHPQNIMYVETQYNNFFELQNFLKKDNFTSANLPK